MTTATIEYPGTSVLIRRDGEAQKTTEIYSYKCEDCGKIIAAPSGNPTPTCCGSGMRLIR